jgi:hypothetical protein
MSTDSVLQDVNLPEYFAEPPSVAAAAPVQPALVPKAASHWKSYLVAAAAGAVGYYVSKNKGWKMAIGVALITAVVVWLIAYFALKW